MATPTKKSNQNYSAKLADGRTVTVRDGVKTYSTPTAVPKKTATNKAPATRTDNTYTVQKGDTLNSIANKYGFSSFKQAGISGYKSGDPNLIFPGEVLKIGGVPTTPSKVSPSNIDAFINANQENDMQTESSKDAVPKRMSRTEKAAAMFTEITGKDTVFGDLGDKPEAPKFLQSYNDLRKQYGVKGLEDSLAELESEEEELVARRRQRMGAEQNKQVAMNVISGRMTEVERQEAERLDYIVRQKNTLVNQVNAANATIENIINFKKLDYDTAKSAYDSEFNQSLTLFNTIKGMVDSDATDEERLADNARANLNIIYGTIKDGGMPPSAMSSAMKLQVNKLEMEAGLPSGFYENVALSNPEGKILSTTTRTVNGAKYADLLMRNPDGSITVKNVYVGAEDVSGSGNSAVDAENKEIAAARKDAAELLSQLDAGEIGWGAAFNSMKLRYPSMSNELIDNWLNKTDNY